VSMSHINIRDMALYRSYIYKHDMAYRGLCLGELLGRGVLKPTQHSPKRGERIGQLPKARGVKENGPLSNSTAQLDILAQLHRTSPVVIAYGNLVCGTYLHMLQRDPATSSSAKDS
jgi:hypothetical protein